MIYELIGLNGRKCRRLSAPVMEQAARVKNVRFGSGPLAGSLARLGREDILSVEPRPTVNLLHVFERNFIRNCL
jgi:hypothetical protein